MDFKLGQGYIVTPSLRMPVNSDPAMNSGNKPYRRSIISNFPDVVAKYIECGLGTKYELVQLKVAVTQSTTEG